MSTVRTVRCPGCQAAVRLTGDTGICPGCQRRLRIRREPAPRPRARRTYECPFCGSTATPVFRRRLSPLGWVVVVAGTLITCIGGLLGLLFLEDYRVCPECGGKL